MPSSTPDLKTSLVNDMWLPLVKSGGDQLFPRLRKNKKMRLFTLTDMNCHEIRAFEENNLIRRNDVVVWTHSYLQKLRLETELGQYKEILYEGRFDNTVNEQSQAILDCFLCDILNLDFFSQKPASVDGRIEREINAVNTLIKLLNNHQTNGFILLYTSLLDQTDLSLDNLAFSLTRLRSFSDPACCVDDKVEFIRSAVISALHNNSYDFGELRELLIDHDNTDKIVSIGLVSSRRS